MNSESLLIADQLRRAFTGTAWHGPSLRELLDGVSAEQAYSRPLPSGHSIWELVLHIELWAHLALDATHEIPMPKVFGTERDWPKASDSSKAAWTRATENLFQTGEQLAQTIVVFADSGLQEIVPGREYDFYYLFHGIVQHSLYHGGQIAMLKRA